MPERPRADHRTRVLPIPLPRPLSLYHALPSDAAAYSRVAAETYFEAYNDTADSANMAVHLAREYGELQQRRELEDPAIAVLAAREPDGEWAGFVALRRGSIAEGVHTERPIEILRFYVRGRWHGLGAAQLLMRAAVAHAESAGHDSVWLQVWEHNARARRFYEKCGYTAVGTNPFLFGDVNETDVVYLLPF